MRFFWILTVFSLLGFLGLVAVEQLGKNAPQVSALADAGGLGVSDLMLVVHGPKGLRAQIQEAVTNSTPADDKAWKAVKARAATIVYLSENVLAKAKPEKGDAASWKTKVAEYSGIARALVKSCGDKDAGEVKTALGKLAKTCESCHKAHK